MSETRQIDLKTYPVLITKSKAYIQAINGEFLFVFSDEKPSITNSQAVHRDTKIYLDGHTGNLWAWKKYSWRTKLIVSV
ncbi:MULTISPECIES: hypothetical protein [Acinetobacter]|jgi:hypothetical protein|uniref:Uncharacterized protein n=1 Tax=Acinetobacter pollinis TaxID=2605270 RepID=A0ABU6DVE5_9GAMM|nr:MULTISPECIES: hypothetical protein [Acinetobacter]MBF7699890.1 hypothetical protein [Acinetobacter pollinis]MEB5476857.1 hypothetical protein [Acinetobacter pollinis]WEV49115.1 hypothetical protein OZX61_01080 [Acinetobacter sp. ESL0695]